MLRTCIIERECVGWNGICEEREGGLHRHEVIPCGCHREEVLADVAIQKNLDCFTAFAMT